MSALERWTPRITALLVLAFAFRFMLRLVTP